MTETPFNPGKLSEMLSEASLQAQNQTYWAQIGHRLERILATHRQVNLLIDSDGGVTVEAISRSRPIPVTFSATTLGEAVALLLGDSSQLRCCDCGDVYPIDQFPFWNARRQKRCIFCHSKKMEKVIGRKKAVV